MTKSTQLANKITDGTVLGEWFQPMDRALDNVRFSDKKFASLPMRSFILFGCLAVWLFGCLAVWLFGWLFTSGAVDSLHEGDDSKPVSYE